MDQYTSTVIIAIITGIFSVITLIIQKKQDVVINKIDEQTVFIEQEKTLQQTRTAKEKERENIINKIMLLILDTNLYILGHELDNDKVSVESNEQANKLKEEFNKIDEEIQDIDKQYDMLMDLSDKVNEQEDNDDRKKKKN